MTKRVTKRLRKCRNPACTRAVRYGGHGRPPIYCTPACRQAAYLARRRKTASKPFAALVGIDAETARLRSLVPKLVAEALIGFGLILPDDREKLIERLALEAAVELPLQGRPRRRRR